MATFTKWEWWQGDEKHQTLVGIDPMGEGLATYHQLAEVREDNDGMWWSFAYLPDFWVVHDVYSAVSYWMPDEKDVCKAAVEGYLHEQGVI
jgi:hypothetical protein